MNLKSTIIPDLVPDSDLAALLACGITTEAEHQRFSPDQLRDVNEFLQGWCVGILQPHLATQWDNHGSPVPVLQWRDGTRLLVLQFMADGSVLYEQSGGNVVGFNRHELFSSGQFHRLLEWVNP